MCELQVDCTFAVGSRFVESTKRHPTTFALHVGDVARGQQIKDPPGWQPLKDNNTSLFIFSLPVFT